jgi:membrane-associated phospholipid phosphatase
MAATVFTLLPKQRRLGLLAIAYALYVGIGVSMTIHWFSDFVAGAIVGSVVGTAVGKRIPGKTSNT